MPGKIDSFSGHGRSNERHHPHNASRLRRPPRDVRHRSTAPCPPPNITSRSHTTGCDTAARHSLSECPVPDPCSLREDKSALNRQGCVSWVNLGPEIHNLVPRGCTPVEPMSIPRRKLAPPPGRLCNISSVPRTPDFSAALSFFFCSSSFGQ